MGVDVYKFGLYWKDCSKSLKFKL